MAEVIVLDDSSIDEAQSSGSDDEVEIIFPKVSTPAATLKTTLVAGKGKKTKEAVEDTIPCDTCSLAIPTSEYADHAVAHELHSRERDLISSKKKARK